jgi:hypothetical protein
MKQDERRKQRRAAWEATQTPEQVKAADAERLARLRLKFRLLGHIEKSRELKGAIDEKGNDLRWSMAKLERRAKQAALGFIQRKEAKNKKASRCVQLAHSFMRGTAYARAEQTCWVKPDWPQVTDVLDAHNTDWQRYEQWYQTALAHLKVSFKGVEPSKDDTLKKLQRKRNKLNNAISMVS